LKQIVNQVADICTALFVLAIGLGMAQGCAGDSGRNRTTLWCRWFFRSQTASHGPGCDRSGESRRLPEAVQSSLMKEYSVILAYERHRKWWCQTCARDHGHANNNPKPLL